MASIDVLTAAGKKAGTVELDGRRLRHRAQRAGACTRSSPPSCAARRAGTPVHQDPGRGPRRRRQAVEPEGHRPGPPGLDPLPALARRRRGPRPEAPQLRAAHPQEDGAPGPALGPVRPGRRRQGRRRRRLGLRRPEHQGRPSPPWPRSALDGQGPRRADGDDDVAAWKSFRNLTDVHMHRRPASSTPTTSWSATGSSSPRPTLPRRPPAGRHRAEEDDAREGPPRRHPRAGREREVLRAARRRTSTRSSVHPDASKPEIRDAVEAIFGVTVAKVNTLNRKGKRKRNRRTGTVGQAPRHQAGHRHPRRGRPIDLFEELRTMALRKRKPTSAGRRFQTVSDFSEITKDHAREVAARPQAARPVAATTTAARPPATGRRPQAAVPHRRLQAEQGRRAGQGRGHRVRPEPQLPHRAAALPRRREALHPRPRRT